MPKLTLNDSPMDILTKMSEGNPGALQAMIKLIEESEKIDPQAMEGILKILMLDEWSIYGSGIYVLYSDKCDKNIRKFIMLIRSVQLGFFSHIKLLEMANDQARKINLTEDEFNDLDKKVCAELKDFMKKE